MNASIQFLALLPLLPLALQDSAPEQDRPTAPVEQRLVLTDGTVAILRHLPEAGAVALASLHPVGVFREPSGLPLASAQLELAASESTGAGYVLGDWAAFEEVVLPAEVDSLLAGLAQRLRGARTSSPQAALDVGDRLRALTERRPDRTLEALAGLNQAWRYGAESLELFASSAEPRVLAAFHRSSSGWMPRVVVVVGAFDPQTMVDQLEASLPLAEDTPAAAPPAPIDWGDVPRQSTLRWNLDRRVLCLTWAAPDDPADRLTLSWLADALAQRLMRDPAIAASFESIGSSSLDWPVGEMPFFICAEVAPGVELDEAEAQLTQRIDAWVEEGPYRASQVQISTALRELLERPRRDWDTLSYEMTLSPKEWREDPMRIRRFYLGEMARQRGRVELLLGPDPDALVEAMGQREHEQVLRTMREHLAPGDRVTTRFVPAK